MAQLIHLRLASFRYAPVVDRMHKMIPQAMLKGNMGGRLLGEQVHAAVKKQLRKHRLETCCAAERINNKSTTGRISFHIF